MFKRSITALFLYFILSLSTWVQANDKPSVLLATTTSTENSGLLAYLLPEMEADTGYAVKVIAVGTGKALKMGQDGDVDVLLVHAKPSELAFVDAGHGVGRKQVMYNDFVIVGPQTDPADLAGVNSSAEAFSAIATAEALFVSRGDDSGTHKKELQIWQASGVSPQGNWYREVGQGMGKTLQIASELDAYALTDRGTWIFAARQSDLKILFQGDPPLNNQYSVILVNPERHDVNHEGAKAFRDWLAAPKAQEMIDAYQIEGQQLFHANAE